MPGVIGDANQLIQVFLNLVTNAEQAIREVRESGRIQIRFARIGSRVSVAFQDDGVGIRPESVPRLFDPFYTTKRPGGGTGLGLSICLSIIREHGGTIEAEALPAGGSAFTVYLPLALGEKPSVPLTATPIPSRVPSPATPDLLKGRSILVLDDEESLRSLLFEGLTAHGLRVDCAATFEEALAFLAERSHDAILCDLNLTQDGAHLSGKSAAESLLGAAGTRKPAVVYMTGELIESPETSRQRRFTSSFAETFPHLRSPRPASRNLRLRPAGQNGAVKRCSASGPNVGLPNLSNSGRPNEETFSRHESITTRRVPQVRRVATP